MSKSIRKRWIIIVVVVAALTALAGARIARYYFHSDAEYQGEIAAVWEGASRGFEIWTGEFRHRVDVLPDDDSLAPAWKSIRGDEAIGVTAPYAPTHAEGPWRSPVGEAMVTLLRAYVANPSAVPTETLNALATRLRDIAARDRLSPLETAVDPNTHDYDAILDNITAYLAESPELAWATADINHGIASRAFDPTATAGNLSPIAFQQQPWDPWWDVALMLAAQGHLALRKGDDATASDRSMALYDLAELVVADPWHTMETLRHSEGLRYHGDRILWRLIEDEVLTDSQREAYIARFAARQGRESLKEAIQLTSAHLFKLHTEDRGLDERLGVFHIYGATRSLLDALDESYAAFYETWLYESANAPRYATYTRRHLDRIFEVSGDAGSNAMAEDLLKRVDLLNEHKTAHGVYPDTLGEVGAFPASPFTGAPLLYERQGDGFIIRMPGGPAGQFWLDPLTQEVMKGKVLWKTSK